MEYDPEAAKRQIEMSSPDVREYVKRMRDTIDGAVNEIERLRGVIRDHVRSASGHIVDNYDVEPVTHISIDGMRTLVRSTPQLYDFYLMTPLGGWSADHRQAFHETVVRGFSERNAEKIAKSIWSAGTV